MHTRLEKGNVAIVHALTGEGGVGKTELAKAYALSHADDYDGRWWLDASEDAIEASTAAVLEAVTATSVGQCCANIRHFSDYILVSPAKQKPPHLWCFRHFFISVCGGGIVPCLSIMFVVLGLAKVRRAARAGSLTETLP